MANDTTTPDHEELDVAGKHILAIVAHPDDIDFGGAGSVAKWIKEGAKVSYIILTDGTRGSEDMSITASQLREMRQEEQRNAGKVVGLTDIYFMDNPDGALQNTPEVQKPVVKIIRQLKPDIVITTDPTYVYDAENGFINHPDHRNAGQIALDCVFPFARNGRSFPELLEEGHEIHSVGTVLINNIGKANFYVDISDYLDTKLEAIKQHVSQYEDFPSIKERMTARAEQLGERIGVKYAEGFVKISSQR